MGDLMALKKVIVIDLIQVLEDGTMQIRQATRVEENGKEIDRIQKDRPRQIHGCDGAEKDGPEIGGWRRQASQCVTRQAVAAEEDSGQKSSVFRNGISSGQERGVCH